MNNKELKYNYDQLEGAWRDGLKTGLFQPSNREFSNYFEENFKEEEKEIISDVKRRLLKSFKVDLKNNSISIPNRTELSLEELKTIKEMNLHVQYIGF